MGSTSSLPCWFFFQAEDGIRGRNVTGVQTCALPISLGLEDLHPAAALMITAEDHEGGGWVQIFQAKGGKFVKETDWIRAYRSEERRVGKERGARWLPGDCRVQQQQRVARSRSDQTTR